MARKTFSSFRFSLLCLFLLLFREVYSQSTGSDPEIVLEPVRLYEKVQSNKWDVCSAFCEKHFLVWIDDRDDTLEQGIQRIYGGFIDEPSTRLISSDKTPVFESKPAVDAGQSFFVVVWVHEDSENLKNFR